jgi:predicted alpha/beta-fold hydrolase
MMKKYLKSWLHKLFLPRGRQFIPNEKLEVFWTKRVLNYQPKTLVVLENFKPDAKGLVILCHPYLAEARQFYLKRGHADLYKGLGWNVVIFDFNGFGESPFVNFRYDEDLDIIARHFKGLYPNLPIVAHGISFGASQVITYSSNSNNILNKIIIENCLDTNLSYYKKRNHRLYKLIKLGMKISKYVNPNYDYVRAAAQIKNIEKALLIYNTDDELTTIEMGKQIVKNMKIPCNLTILSGKHLEAYEKNMIDYAGLIKSFLN